MSNFAKKFVAKDFSQAFNLIKQEFGEDALILSQTKVNNQIEILAAKAPIDNNPQPNQAPSNNRKDMSWQVLVKSNSNINQKHNQYLANSDQNTTPWVAETKFLAKVQDEIRSIANVLNDKLEPLLNNPKLNVSPVKLSILKRLLNLGIDSNLASNLLGNLPDTCNLEDGIVLALKNLLDCINITKNPLEFPNKINLFWGLAGAGKTNLIAHNIFNLIKQQKQDKIALIIVNQDKFGVLETVNVLKRVFNITAFYAESFEDLAKILEICESKSNIFVEMPALFNQNFTLNHVYNKLSNFKTKIANHLVLSSEQPAFLIEKQLNVLGKDNLDRLNITKTDLYSGYGQIISKIITEGLVLNQISQSSDPASTIQTVEKNDILNDLHNFVRLFAHESEVKDPLLEAQLGVI